MKLAFSTLGCPDFSWSDIVATAKDLGYSGIELRGLGDNLFSPRSKPFRPENVATTLEELHKRGLAISCVASGTALKYSDRQRENVAELCDRIDMAARLEAPFVRILADERAEANGEVDDEAVLRALNILIPYAEENGVTLLVETCGVYADTKRLAALLERIPSDCIGALWDVHHPYRFMGETPEQTVQNLGGFIKYTHFKDSVKTDTGFEYRLMGEGDLPFDDIMMALRSINYDGYLSLEWLKVFSPDLTDAGIVFPQYANFMLRYVGFDGLSGRLYDNAAMTGKYLWPKNHLIDLTFPQVLDRLVDEFPDQYAFRFTTLDYTRTYKEFRDDVDEFARALLALGVKTGDHVAVWATNVPEWYIAFWATTKIGAVLVTMNTAYKIHEAEYLLRQSDTHTLIMIDGTKDSDYVAIMKELAPELETADMSRPLHIRRLPFLRNIITVESRQKGCLTWDDALSLASRVPLSEVQRRAAAVNKNDVCNMQYTSGTTGFPKGVMLTHYNVINNGKTIGDCMDLSTADRMMIQVPMFHCFGMVLAMTASVTHGVTMSPIPVFSPSKGLDCINKEKITCFHGVPTMFIAMLNHEKFPDTDFSYMRTGIMAGSPCPVKVMRDVIEKMHMPEICITYGQTEAAPGCTMSKTTDSIETRVNTVGGAMYGVSCKIVDPETGVECPVNVDGEFVAKGYNIMKGYYKMPEATSMAIDAEGWLHTGDLARRDEDGNFRITGRIKDMIIRGGENIYPKEIEDFIYTHPDVADVQVIGVEDKQYGEEIMACIVRREGSTVTGDEIKEYVRSHMARHKTPRYVVFVDSFPLNAAGKVLKYKMRAMVEEYLKLQ